MKPNFQLFSVTHFAILGSIILAAFVSVRAQRRLAPGSNTLNYALAWTLALETLAWDVWLFAHGGLSFPAHLPLELCDITLYLCVIALFTLNSLVCELAWYAALSGCAMALLTPNLYEPFPSLADTQFFIAHALPVMAALYLVWTRQARPRKGSVVLMMLFVNLVALVDGTLDWAFGANYMYLREKPMNVSLLSFMGQWPWYIVGAEGVALSFFLLLYLPFWRGKAILPELEIAPQPLGLAEAISESTEF